MRLGVVICAILMAITASALAQDVPSEIRQFDIATLDKLGGAIYLQQRAYSRAYSALHANHSDDEMRQEKIQGWIEESRNDGVVIRFIRMSDNGPEAAYDVRYATDDFERDAPSISVPADRSLNADEKAQFSAHTLALKGITQPCADGYYAAVLKDPKSDGWLAWAVAGSDNPNMVVTGGHFRLTISADGTKVLRRDALSRSCTVVSKITKGGNKLTALVAAQLVSNVPVETLVFLNLVHRMHFFIMTPDSVMWEVTKGHIVKSSMVVH